jgi:DNA-directed RNA polymerase subunit L
MNIQVLDHKKIDDTYNNYLVISLTSPKLNHVIMNTIRRVIMELVPVYAIDKKDIDITKNTSIYNNDYIKLRISNFPVHGVNNKEDTIERSKQLEHDANVSIFDKKIEDLTILEEIDKRDKLEKSQNLNMYINIKNTTQDILNVTTDDAKFQLEGKSIVSPYKRPLLILKLKPNEEFIGSCISTLNIGLKGANYIPVSACTFTSEENNLYKLNIESLKQLSEKELILRACKIINIKLNYFLKIINERIDEYKSSKISDDFNLNNSSESETESATRNSSDETLEEHRVKGVIKIENESHTFGNLLSRFLQDHKSILFAGYKIDHLLIKELTIAYKTDGTDIINIIDDIIKESIGLFDTIHNNISKLKI